MTDLVGGCLTALPPEDVQIFFSMVINFVFEGGQFWVSLYFCGKWIRTDFMKAMMHCRCIAMWCDHSSNLVSSWYVAGVIQADYWTVHGSFKGFWWKWRMTDTVIIMARFVGCNVKVSGIYSWHWLGLNQPMYHVV